jgi:hypothetical protein
VAGMNRLVVALLVVLVVAVTGLGFLVWKADQHAQDAAEKQACLQKAEATGVFSLLTPADRVDKEGRIQLIEVLANQIDAC